MKEQKIVLGPIFQGIPNHIVIDDIRISFGRRGCLQKNSRISSIVIEKETAPRQVLFKLSLEPAEK